MSYHPIIGQFDHDGTAFRPLTSAGPPGPSAVAPSVPTGLDFVATTSIITLTWAPSTPAPGSTGVDRYIVRRNGVVVGMSFAPSYVDVGLLSASVFGYEVAAVSDEGAQSAWSPVLVTQTLGFTAMTCKFGWQTVSGAGGITPWSAAYAASVSLLGFPRVYRAFRSDDTLPTNWSTWNAPNDNRILYVVSWKPDYATLLAGGYDVIIAAFLAWAHANGFHVVFALWHEYDSKGMNAAQYKAMFAYQATKVRAFNSPYVQTAMINAGAKSAAIQATYLPSDWALLDVFASDPYTLGQAVADRRTYAGGRKAIDAMHYDFKSNYVPESVRSGIGEFGWGTNHSGPGASAGIDAEGAEWYRGAQDRCLEIDALFACMFNADAANQYALIGSRQPAFAQSAAMVKRYVEASPLGFALVA